jgi:hypothetical protein
LGRPQGIQQHLEITALGDESSRSATLHFAGYFFVVSQATENDDA